jgi:hypothetical protein
MFQLIYISSARNAVAPATLADILAVSRRNNARAGITGLLVVGGRRFLQALEGPEQAVLATYDRIQNDPRHRACVLLARRAVSEREFGDWSMAHDGDGSALQETVAALVACIDEPNLRAQFTGFAQLHSRAA